MPPPRSLPPSPRPVDAGRAPLETVARPKQARSERTLHRLLDAAEALIDERGLAELSIPEIVRRAGSSVGGFYARFRDKNELLRALEERFFREQRQRVERLSKPDAWGHASVPEIVRACMAEMLGVFREREALIRAFLARAVHDVEFRGEALRFQQEVAERFGALLLSRPDAIGHPRPALAIDLGIGVVFGAMLVDTLFVDTRDESVALTPEELGDELARMLLGYLDAPWET